MNKEISEMFWISMDIIGGVILITFLLTAITRSRELFSTLEAREVAEDQLADSKSWRGYEGDFITSADICNLVTTKGEESNVITIMISKGNDEFASSSSGLSSMAKTNLLLNDPDDGVISGTKYVENARACGRVPAGGSLTCTRYNNGFTSGTPKALNEVLDETKLYTVKLYKDSTNVVRFAQVKSWKSDTVYSSITP